MTQTFGDPGFLGGGFLMYTAVKEIKIIGLRRIIAERMSAAKREIPHFAYVEDPDGTLIEFVETHKIPITKRFGWYLDLWKRRDVTRPLPDWMLRMIRYMKARPHKL